MAKFITNKGRIDAIRIEQDNSNGIVYRWLIEAFIKLFLLSLTSDLFTF